MPQIRVSAQLQPQHSDWSQMRDAWAAAEALGVDCLFNWDHFFPLNGPPDGKHFEAIATLGAMAGVTERAQIGALVICNSYRNPELLADAHRTIDHISGGRAILGIGAGWFQRDYDEYGYEFGTAGGRLDALGEALPRIEQRWEKLNPKPTRDIPVLIGGGGEKKTLKLVAKHANIWHGFGDAETLAHKHAVLDEHCRTIGRDPGEIERSAGVGDKSPEDIGKSLLDVGTRLFTVSSSGPDYDLGLLREWVTWRDEVNAK